MPQRHLEVCSNQDLCTNPSRLKRQVFIGHKRSNADVARLGLEEESLYPQLDELVTWRVFAVTANGKIQPIDADYLHTDFWARLRERAA
jgi:hypothetical protein